MALIHCEECGREISEHAFACPRCGYPRRRSAPMSRGIKLLLAVFVFMLVAMFGFALTAAWLMRKPIEIQLPQRDLSSAAVSVG